MSRQAVVVWVVLLALPSPAQTQDSRGVLGPQGGSRIYSSDPYDSWNQIFAALFTRTVETRLSDELGGGGPYETFSLGSLALSVSNRTIERPEVGDRAIEPLYPSFLSTRGVLQVLTEPLYSRLNAALESALRESTKRTPVQRALMQADLWAAYDVLNASPAFRRSDRAALLENRSQLLALTARLIRKIALTSEDIQSLPNNFEARVKQPFLPRLLEGEEGWIEIQWTPDRIHDAAADNRRAARVFFKPLSLTDRKAFLQDLRASNRPADKLQAVALAIQLLLVTAQGQVIPSPIINAVQLRTFVRNEEGKITSGRVEQFELSRQLLLEDIATGGFIHHTADAPAYLPSAGNDYGFASWQHRDGGPPVLAALRSRCQACHFSGMTRIATLAIHARPPVPSIVSLDPLKNERAEYVAVRKQRSDQFQALIQSWLSH